MYSQLSPNSATSSRFVLLVSVLAMACSQQPGLSSQRGGGGTVALQSLAVTLGAVSLPAGTKVPIAARAAFADGTSRDVTTEATWTASDGAVVALLPASGIAVATAPGIAEVTAVWGGVPAKASLQVTPGIVLAMTMNPSAVTIAKGTTQQLGISAVLSDGPLDVTNVASWSTSDVSIATVDRSGLVSGVAAGAAKISATFGGAIVSARVVVSPAAVVSLAVSPPDASVPAGRSQTFVATLTLSDGTTQDVTTSASWQSSDVTVGAIAGGRLTTLKEGSTTVSAAYQGKAALSTVTVTAPAVERIVISTEPVFAGLPTQFRATAIYTDASHTTDVTALAQWASVDTSFAAVSSGGVVTGVAAGSATITATYGGKTGSVDIVVDGSALAQVEIWPLTASGPVGFDRQLAATARFADGKTKDVTAVATWSSGTPTIADFVTGRGGLLRPLQAGGPITVTATVLGVSGSAQFTVTGATIDSVVVNGDLSKIALGTKTTFHASVKLSDGSIIPGTDVTWSSDDETVATMEQSGVALGVAPGHVIVSAALSQCPLDPKCTGWTTLDVTSATIQSIAIGPPFVNLPVEVRLPLTLTATISDGTVQDLTRYASWASSDPAVARLDAVKPWVLVGVTPGDAVVTARYGTSYADFSATRDVKVTGAQVASILVTSPAAELVQGTSLQVTANATYSDGNHHDVTDLATWTSSAPAIAAVSIGVGTRGVVSGLHAGPATITAAFGGQSGSVGLTVKPYVTAIAVTPADASIPLGRSQQFHAMATYSDGTEVDLTSTVSWASSNSGAAEFSTNPVQKGLLYTWLEGFTTVTATDPDFQVSGQATVTVSEPAIESLVASPASVTLPAGRQQVFIATAIKSNSANPLDVTADVVWTSSDDAVAAFAGNVLTSKKKGAATLTATDPLTGTQATADVRVLDPVLDGIVITPDSTSLALGEAVQLTLTGMLSDGSSTTSIAGVAWTSSAESIALVDQAGYVRSVSQGPAVITATVADIDPTTATVHVGAPVLRSIALLPGDTSVPLGDTVQFTVEGIYTDGTRAVAAAWTSSRPECATVSPSGLVTTLAEGTASITADVGVTGIGPVTANVQIDAPVLRAIAILPANPSFPLGDTRQFRVEGTYSNGTRDVAATWASSRPELAAMTTGGFLTTIAKGQTVVTADVGVTGIAAATTTVTVTDPVLRSVAIAPANPAIAVGRTQQFRVDGTYSDGTREVPATFTSSRPEFATITTAGFLTAGGKGQTIVTADVGISGVGPATTTVTVTDPEVDHVVVSGDSVFVGFPTQFRAMAVYSDPNHTKDVTAEAQWASLDPAYATVAAGGAVTGVAAGNATVTAQYGGKTGDASFDVDGAALSSVEVSPADAIGPLGFDQQFNATGVFTDRKHKDLTAAAAWASSDTAIADFTATPGLLRPAAAGGPITITASVNGVVGTTSFTVSRAKLKSVDVFGDLLTIASGTKTTFHAVGTLSDGTVMDLTDVTWTSSTTTVATIDPLSGVALGVTPGQATVRATLNHCPLGAVECYGEETLTVTAAHLVSMAITPSPVTIPVGISLPLTATGTMSDQTTQDMSPYADWTSSAESIATVDGSVVTGVHAGTTTVTATYAGILATVDVTVDTATLDHIEVTAASPSGLLPQGYKVQLIATAVFSTGPSFPVTNQATWISDNSGTISVSNASGTRGLATAMKLGTARISATFSDMTGSTLFTVVNGQLQSLVITDGYASEAPLPDFQLEVGGKKRLYATGLFTSDQGPLSIDMTDQCIWLASPKSVAWESNVISKYDFKGMVHAVGAGTANITAHKGVYRDAVDVTVP